MIWQSGSYKFFSRNFFAKRVKIVGFENLDQAQGRRRSGLRSTSAD
jgi:hypothetical protein